MGTVGQSGPAKACIGMLAFMTGITATEYLLWRRLREKKVK
jgi:hypothetical protein